MAKDTNRSTQSTKKSVIRAQSSRIINARAEDIYAVLRDYHVGHAAILPKPYFTRMTVEKGGIGAGTLIDTRVEMFGREYRYHQLVSEPEPGREIRDTDIDTGQFASFRLEPLNGGKKTRVTIMTEAPASPGIVGFLEKLSQPPFQRWLYNMELKNLAIYMQRPEAVNVPAEGTR